MFAIQHFQYDFATTGNVNLPEKQLNNLGASVVVPFQFIPQKWAMQVTGLTALNVAATPSAWTVKLVASLDGIAFNATSAIMSHVSGVQANGDVVWQPTTTNSFFLTRFAQIQVSVLTLGATATKLRVCIIGDR